MKSVEDHNSHFIALLRYIDCQFSRIIINTVSEDHILKPIKNGKNVIHVAAEIGLLSTLNQLCKKVKSPFVLDDKGNSSIHYAASEGHLQILQMLHKYLKSSGTDLTIPNGNGDTPLQLAKLKGHSKVVKYLVECERKQIKDNYNKQRYSIVMQKIKL